MSLYSLMNREDLEENEEYCFAKAVMEWIQ
jgi:hypothetical protein